MPSSWFSQQCWLMEREEKHPPGNAHCPPQVGFCGTLPGTGPRTGRCFGSSTMRILMFMSLFTGRDLSLAIMSLSQKDKARSDRSDRFLFLKDTES